jgi:hypothetical protein
MEKEENIKMNVLKIKKEEKDNQDQKEEIKS